MKKVAIQGYSGCFHEEAARKFYRTTPLADDIEIVECDTFAKLFESMHNGQADAAVMAIENTVSGGLIPNFELLRRNPDAICGEVFLRIEQNLMALPGQSIEEIHEVRTHYMAINQTREFFNDKPWIKLVESEDTAKSAAQIAHEGLRGVCAIGSKLAAETYGLQIIAPGIETCKQNFTRFLIFDKKLYASGEKNAARLADKASLCFTLPHTPGSLAHILTILSFYGMNLTRIQSLPIPGREWQYFFYADIKFDSHERYSQAISAVRPLIDEFRILGEYNAAI